jgi:hypothetical protein
MHPVSRVLGHAAVALLTWLPLSASAAPPSVRNIDLRGAQIGGTTTLTIDGVDLPTNPKLVMSAPIAAQTVRPNASATRAEIDVTLDSAATPGLYNLFVAGEGGISEKTIVALDRLPQRPFAPAVDALPVALHGSLGGSTLLRTIFPAKAGQRVTCEVESQRLGAKLRPVLHLYDPEGKHLAWSLPSPSLRGDTRLSTVVNADGQYALTLNDLQFAVPGPGHFRLKIGEWEYADAVFPAAVERGTTATLRLIGNSPASQFVALAPPWDASSLGVAWPPTSVLFSGPLPAVLVSDIPELVEQHVGAGIQALAGAPSAMNGCLSAAGELDRFRIKLRPAATPGAKLRFEVFAARLGSSVDTALEVQREDGTVLAANDDAPGTTDSLVELATPTDQVSLVVAIKDVQGRGNDASIYRLLVTAPTADPVRGDFQLFMEQDRYNVPQNGRQVVRVRVDRQGYHGPIKLDFGQLPAGVSFDSNEIAAGLNGKLITFTGAGESLGQILTTVRGRAMLDLARPVIRRARSQPDPAAGFQPWLADEIAISLSARGGLGFDVDWRPAAESKLVLGAKLAAPVRCVRPPGYDGPVRLTMVTNQFPPQLNGVDDPNRSLRPESPAAVEIPPDAAAQAAWDAKLAADKVLADTQSVQIAAAKAVADAQAAGGATLEAATKAKADADANAIDAAQKKTAADEAANAASAAAKNDANYSVLVPADLPPRAVEVAFRAELLSRDRQRVLMTLSTPVRTVAVFNPLGLQYTGRTRLSARLDHQSGAGLKLTGKIERLEGLTGDVAVSMAGLPPAVPVPRVVVAAAATDFELELKIPENVAPGELNGVQLFATGKMTPASPLEIRSEPVGLVIELLPE